MVRSNEQRGILFDMAVGETDPAIVGLTGTYHNLQRQWPAPWVLRIYIAFAARPAEIAMALCGCATLTQASRALLFDKRS